MWSRLSLLCVGEDEEQVSDAGVDRGRRTSEDGVVVLVGAVVSGRVGDAPVDEPRLVAEAGADLADLVTEADHVVEPAVGQRAQMPWMVLGDVDAVLLTQDSHGGGVDVWPGPAAGAGCPDPACGLVAQERLRHRGARAVARTGEQHGGRRLV